jgi:hypothetical protein
MLYRDAIAAYSYIHTERMNMFCGFDGEFSVLNAVMYTQGTYLLTYLLHGAD